MMIQVQLYLLQLFKLLILLHLYDLTGSLVETLVNGELVISEHEVTWNAAGYPSGVYVIQLVSGN